MKTENQENKSSFICFNCTHINFFDPFDYSSDGGKGELLLENLTSNVKSPNPKTKKVIIACEECSSKNIVVIS